MVLSTWWMTNASVLLSMGLGSGIKTCYCNFKTFWGGAEMATMQEAKASAGTMERAELPPSGVACDIFCLRELGNSVPLENLFFIDPNHGTTKQVESSLNDPHFQFLIFKG